MYITMHGITTSAISFANKGFIKNGITLVNSEPYMVLKTN